jgi:hypothetical protein
MNGHMHNPHQYRQGGIDHILKERAHQAQLQNYAAQRPETRNGSGEAVKSAVLFGTLGLAAGGPVVGLGGFAMGWLIGKLSGK